MSPLIGIAACDDCYRTLLDVETPEGPLLPLWRWGDAWIYLVTPWTAIGLDWSTYHDVIVPLDNGQERLVHECQHLIDAHIGPRVVDIT